jgi:hypothetical protein
MMAYLKAIYGGVIAALTSAAAAYAAGGGHIGWQAGIGIAIAGLSVFGGVWGVPNTPKTPPTK